MKRLFVVLAVVIFVSIGLSSCKSHEKCPAYGQATEEQTDNDRA